MGQDGAPGPPDDGGGGHDASAWRAATGPAGPTGPTGLSAALRGRATLKMHGPEGYRLVLHRSAVSRVLTVMVLALILVLLSLLGLKALADPFDRDSRGAFWLVVIVLAIPATLRAINLFRRRTVLSASGIELHRLVWTERRPWPAAPSGFDISARVISDEHADQIARYRLALVDSTPDELTRMPGCVFDGTWRWRSSASRDQARAALKDIWELAERQGWLAAGPRAAEADQCPAEARSDPLDANAAGGPLVYGAPAWRRIWELLCDAGLLLICLGVLLILAAAAFLVQARHNVVDVFYALLLLLPALAALGCTAVMLSTYLRKTVVDREGIVAGGEKLAWPQSRSGLYVLGDRVALESPDGRVTALPGTGGVHADFERRGAVAAAQCEEIRRWGVANGVVQRGASGG